MGRSDAGDGGAVLGGQSLRAMRRSWPMIDQTSSDLGIEDKSGLSPVGLGSPLDVANVVLFLASDESRFVNGSEIVLDNALTIQ